MRNILIALIALMAAVFVGHRIYTHRHVPTPPVAVVVVAPAPVAVVPTPHTKPVLHHTTPRKPMTKRPGTPIGKPLDIHPPVAIEPAPVAPAPGSFEDMLARARAARNGPHSEPVDCNLIRFWYAHFTTAQIRALQRAYGPTQRELRDARLCMGE